MRLKGKSLWYMRVVRPPAAPRAEDRRYRRRHGPVDDAAGIEKYTDRLTAIVTVADDGGGSGVLRREMGILPPGDVRQCMQALANTEPVMEQLLGYRFPEGQLKGQSFGNLLLAALNGMAGSFEEAVAMMGQVLAISGRVLPVTNADVQLEAVFENGARVVGESHIFNAKSSRTAASTTFRLCRSTRRRCPTRSALFRRPTSSCSAREAFIQA